MATKIEWTDETWNPIIGCSKVSPGCANCYAEPMAGRLAIMAQHLPYNQVTHYVADELDEKDKFDGWNGKTAFVESALYKPLRWKKPRRIFVCSMGDLFHESVQFAWIDQVFAVMALCPQHTFQILTKRPDRMAEYYQKWHGETGTRNGIYSAKMIIEYHMAGKCFDPYNITWPLPNVWIGITSENQEHADKRIPELLKCPAAVRFVSIEPMLGPVDLDCCLHSFLKTGIDCTMQCSHEARLFHELDWVICGGESGPKARPMNPDWVRSLRDQCQAANVPFLFKQWGEWAPNCECGRSKPCKTIKRPAPGGWGVMFRCGKKKSGRKLDGVTHDEFPDNVQDDNQKIANES